MCYYNGQKVTHAEFIRLKQLKKMISRYDFLERDLQIGFDYSLNAVLKRQPDEEDLDIVQKQPLMRERKSLQQIRRFAYRRNRYRQRSFCTGNIQHERAKQTKFCSG